jgi:hypothetical protein
MRIRVVHWVLGRLYNDKIKQLSIKGATYISFQPYIEVIICELSHPFHNTPLTIAAVHPSTFRTIANLGPLRLIINSKAAFLTASLS